MSPSVEPRAGPVRALSRLLPGAASTFAVQAGGFALVFVMHAAVARRLGVEALGSLNHVLSLAGLLGLLATLGWNTAVVRLTAQYRQARAWGLLAGARRAGHRSTWVAAVTTSGVLLAVSFSSDLRSDLATRLRFAAAAVPLLASLEMHRRALQGLERFASSLVPEQVLLPLLVLVGLFVVPWPASAAPDDVAVGLWAVSALVAFLVAQGLGATALPHDARGVRPEYRTRAWFALALPLAASTFSNQALSRVDVAVLGVLADLRDVGQYAAAKRLVQVGVFAQGALNIVAGPALAAAWHGGRHAQFRSVIRRVRWLSCAAGVPVFGIALVAPGLVLSVFDVQGSVAERIVRILALGQLTNVAAGPVGLALAMSGRERAHALVTGTTAVLATLGYAVAIRSHGALGAAVVTASSVAFQNVALFGIVRYDAVRSARERRAVD